MSTEEPKSDEPKPKPDSSVASENGGVDAGVAWPPPEAAPEPQAAKPAEADKPAAPSPAAAADQPPAATAAAAADDAAAMPEQEMGLSNSTLHWLEDESAPAHIHEPGTMPSYDPKAPVAGRTRAVVVLGGAALLAIAIAGYFYAQSAKRQAEAPPAAAVMDPARNLTGRAQAALAASKYDEALELANLALVADPRFADAHFVVATCMMARSNTAAARDEFRKYLELAPLGTHAQAARDALAKLPP
jgi:tetratricopeptide (TPR) repeat protein